MRKGKTWEQHKAECQAVAGPGVTVIGCVEPFKNVLTKVIAVCDIHGEFTGKDIRRFKANGNCPKCSMKEQGKIRQISREDFMSQCREAAKEGVTVVDLVEPYNGSSTRLICKCDIHGEWNTTTIASLRKGSGCPECAEANRGQHCRILEEDHIAKFFATGKFKPGSIFIKDNETLNTQGYATNWFYTCPVCSVDEYTLNGLCTGTFVGYEGNLKVGSSPCRCSLTPHYTPEQWDYRIRKVCKQYGYHFVRWETEERKGNAEITYLCPKHGEKTTTPNSLLVGYRCGQCNGQSQKEAYITFIGNGFEYENFKFGIACNSLKRIKDQKREAKGVRIDISAIYAFPTVKQCRAAERAVFAQLADHTGSVPKEVLPDGYTETLPISFMQQVEEIYKEHGGTIKPVSLEKPKRQKVRKKR